MKSLSYPLDYQTILRSYKAFKRKLSSFEYQQTIKIAILGGSTTAQLADILSVFLMKIGIRPCFYESQYNKYYEDIMFENEELQAFQPDIIYLHTTNRNISNWPQVSDTPEGVEDRLDSQYQRFQEVWDKIKDTYHCAVIQNNFELSDQRLLGNLDSYDLRGHTHFMMELNQRIAQYARSNTNFHINDIHYLSSSMGLDTWYDEKLWYAYKYAMSLEGLVMLAYNLSVMIKSMYGLSKKCLVTDLDNTLWGGVIGDDGLENIELGPETPLGEAYTDVQQYLKQLKQRGIILAVCSKNDDHTAKQGLTHPDSVLTLEDFAHFTANWQEKHESLKQMAIDLAIGLDSLVFLDDNPVERQLVADQLPTVAVPNIGSDVTQYIKYLSHSGYFEPVTLSTDDLQRSQYYQANAERSQSIATYGSYDDFLLSLNMHAEIKFFSALYLDRITQLINKTNQFNLTTRRYILPEVQTIANDDSYLTLYGRLEDKFGDNGVVAGIIGRLEQAILHIDLWVMSCRVLKRSLEIVMFDQLVYRCQQRGINVIQGSYIRTPKNGMVADHYQKLGFERILQDSQGNSSWRFVVSPAYCPQNHWMEVNHEG